MACPPPGGADGCLCLYRGRPKGKDRYMTTDNWPYGPNDRPHNFIQWKGTDVCMDVYCKCGAHTHLDAEFAYYVQCGKCGTIWELANFVEMREVERQPPDRCQPVVTDYDP